MYYTKRWMISYLTVLVDEVIAHWKCQIISNSQTDIWYKHLKGGLRKRVLRECEKHLLSLCAPFALGSLFWLKSSLISLGLLVSLFPLVAMGSQVCHNFQMTLRRYVDILIFFSKPHLDIECQVLLAASSCVHTFVQ